MKTIWMAGLAGVAALMAAAPGSAQGMMGRDMRGAVGLQFLRAADADGDRSITRAELDALATEEFAWRDRNADGALDENDASPAVRRLVAARADDPDAADRPRRRGARADADEDGRVTQAEFMAAESALFERLDADSDSVVTPDELDAQLEARRNRARWWRAP